MNATIERRTLLKAAAMGATGLALAPALGALTGCSGNDLDPQTDWLPLGTVIKTKDSADTDLEFMIVARKPRISSMILNGKTTNLDAGAIDYACVLWPVGFLSDLSQKTYTGELKVITKEEISEVLYPGYQDDLESQASNLYDAAEDSSTADEVLSDIYLTLADQASANTGSSSEDSGE